MQSLKVFICGRARPELLIIEHMEVDLVFSRLFEKKSLCIMDIGSHHGEFLDIFEHHNHPHTYSVICVEPMLNNLKVLHSKIKSWRRVKAIICPVAISDVSGPKTFYEGTADTVFTCTESWIQAFPEHFKNPVEIKIDCLTIVDLAQQFNIDIEESFDFIKIDTEGHDLNVLKSLMSARIKTFAIMFEIGPDISDIVSAIDLLRSQSFNEFYVFGRTGINTRFIGEYEGKDQLYDLRRKGRLDAGNIVAFHSLDMFKKDTS